MTFQNINRLFLKQVLLRKRSSLFRLLYYKNSVLDMQYQKSMADYSVRQDGISKYDEAMIGTVMIPAVNEKKRILYVQNQYRY